MKLKLRLLLVLFVGLLSAQLAFSDETSSHDTVQLSLTVISTGQLNISAVKQVEKGINAFDAIDQLVVVGFKGAHQIGAKWVSLIYCGVSDEWVHYFRGERHHFIALILSR